MRNPHQPRNVDRDHLDETLIRRVEPGGMVLVNSDIYPVDPLNTQFVDIVLPAGQEPWGLVMMSPASEQNSGASPPEGSSVLRSRAAGWTGMAWHLYQGAHDGGHRAGRAEADGRGLSRSDFYPVLP